MQSLMTDIAGTTLTAEDVQLLTTPSVAGVILFGRNCDTPKQVRALTDSIKAVNPALIIATDQEGGRVARLRQGFTPLPAMGQLGQLYDDESDNAVKLAWAVGYLMACETLAVGIDISFAPVLDIDNGSLVIGDRAFHTCFEVCQILAGSFVAGMGAAGMGATGKHFPGHGSVIPDSHVADAVDDRDWQTIWETDLSVFRALSSHLFAVMPAHVVYCAIDDKPAGFSYVWLQDILRQKIGFDGVIFSDDLSMKAAHVAGGVGERVMAALQAGCDVVLVCNDRAGAWEAAQVLTNVLPDPKSHQRIARMQSKIPTWQGDLMTTCQQFTDYAYARQVVVKFMAQQQVKDKEQVQHDPTAFDTALL